MQFWNRNALRMTRITALAFAASLFALVPACRAQVDTPGDVAAPVQQQQPSQAAPDSAMVPAQPRIRVVRLSDVEGSVKILRADQTQFPQAVMNMPLTEGSQIDTGADGRAEIEMEDGSVARITPNSSLKIAELTSTPGGPLDTTLEQRSGLIYYELRYDPKNTFHVDFSGRSASPAMNSTFRIDLKAAPQELAVLDGKVQVADAKVPVSDGKAQGAAAANSFSVQVLQGKTIQFPQSAQGKPETAQYSIKDWVTPNGFDDWNEQRDQEAAEQAQNQTPARVQQGGGSIMDSAVGFGWSDLDNAGSWYPLPGYGMVWQPYGVGADFDPYANGMWADFGGGLGYSWVSGYPWGWLPYNCGAWSYIGSFGWGWTPGMNGCGRSGFGIGIGLGYGGYGLGYGGYGRGNWHHRWRNGQYPHTNIHGGPPGYHAPMPPAIGRGGQRPPRIVRVGASAAGMRSPSLDRAHGHGGREFGNRATRRVEFNGAKIAPLRSTMNGVQVPQRNAALYNNYPAHAFHGNLRDTLMSRSAGMDRDAGSMRGSRAGFDRNRGAYRGGTPASMQRNRTMNLAGKDLPGGHGFGGGNRHAFGQHRAVGDRVGFGQHRAIGQRPGFGQRSGIGQRPGFNRPAGFARSSSFGAQGRNGAQGMNGGFRGGNRGFAGGNFHHGGGFHGGAARMGGFSGGAMRGGGMPRSAGPAGGFHGGGAGSHGGGGGFSGGGGGGFHGGGGGGFHGGGGGGHAGGGASAGGGHAGR